MLFQDVGIDGDGIKDTEDIEEPTETVADRTGKRQERW